MIFISGFDEALTKPTMKFVILAVAGMVLLSGSASAQKQKPSIPVAPPSLVRTITHNETHRLGYGGTLTLIGAPEGSITIEGWSRSEVEVRAEIQMTSHT
jgi:hypothetical protein